MWIKDLVPEGWNYFIAGGYAACPSLASDIDVWAQPPSDDYSTRSFGFERRTLIQHLRNIFGVSRFTEETSENPGEEYIFASHCIRILKVGKLEGVATLPIHVMITDGDVTDVLRGFDVSTHAVALTDFGVVKGDGWTSVCEAPRRLLSNPKTESRIRKISERYGF